MSTALEDRLVSALRARAEEVRPEDLRPVPPPAAFGAPTWRRSAVYVAAAAAVTAAVGIPLWSRLEGSDDRGPKPDQPPVASRDVDGDGRPDRASLATDGTLTVRLATEESLSWSFPRGTELIGLADIGGAGAAVVTAGPQHGQLGTRDISVLQRIAQGGSRGILAKVEQVGLPPQIGETFTTWIADGVLYSGSWEEGAGQQVRLRTASYFLDPNTGELGPVTQPDWCWDRATEPDPRPCAGNDEFAPPVGGQASLPALFPESSAQYLYHGQVWLSDIDGDGTTDVVRLAGKVTRDSAKVTDGQVHLIVDDGSGGWDVPLPGGALPALSRELVLVGPVTPRGAIVVVGGNSVGVTYTLYDARDGRQITVPAHSGVPMFSGVPIGGDAEYTTWIAGRRLYTRLATGDPLRYQVWRWRVVDQLGGPAVVPDPLGTVCIDTSADPYRYGDCSGG